MNTRPMTEGALEERLTHFADLVRWALHSGLIDEAQASRLKERTDTTEARTALADALALREVLRALFASPRGAGDIAGAATVLNRALRRRSGHLRLDSGGATPRLDFAAPLEKPADLVAAIAGEIGALLADGRLDRVKPCGGKSCVLWFLDTTRNGSRHWCRMERCGSRMKAAAFYKRHRAAAAL